MTAMRYDETPGGAIRAALGYPEPDPDQIEERAEQIKTEVERSKRARYGDSDWSLSLAQAQAVAVTEHRASQVFFSGTTHEFAELVQRRYPWATVLVGPDPDLSAGREHMRRQIELMHSLGRSLTAEEIMALGRSL